MGFPRWTAGKPPILSARAWNAFGEQAERAESERFSRIIPPAHMDRFGAIVEVQNTTDTLRSRAHVLGLNEPVVLPTTSVDQAFEDPVWKGALPSISLHRRQFAVLLEEIAPGWVGSAMQAGICWVQIDVVDEAHPFATIKDNDATQLQSYWWGRAKILWKETGTGTKWARVELGPFTYQHYIGTFEGTWDKGTSKDVTVWTGTGPAASASSSLIEDVYNRYGDLEEELFVRVGFDNDGPEAVAAECPDA